MALKCAETLPFPSRRCIQPCAKIQEQNPKSFESSFLKKGVRIHRHNHIAQSFYHGIEPPELPICLHNVPGLC
ncbi:hypothetical protein TIFTF001_015606 [Ficus carica]|uniref:Uncharacterized protein n=1 Tax=Ficus carica TaxID=3494 RepID=A0AA88D6N6_FICCA|nr:hypothetical protein TIFTF001_015606 [Ficus carica]